MRAAPVGENMTHNELLTALDAPRGNDPWNSGPRITLRALFANRGVYATEAPRWFWYRDRTDIGLSNEREGAWLCNNLDHLAAVEWEQARRAAGVSDATVAEWLGVTP
jgi:hypothetical protein